MLDKTTPVMQQYLSTKAGYEDCLLFFQLGDFYELFFEDAIEASQILGIALTKRGTFKGADIPMCGVPLHSSAKYLQILLRNYRKVAICEQLETPEQAKMRGHKAVIKREVTRIITPGTLLEDTMLENKETNYLLAVSCHGSTFGLAWIDISTSHFFFSSIPAALLETEIMRIAPKEILITHYMYQTDNIKKIIARAEASITKRPNNLFDIDRASRILLESYGLHSLDGLGLQHKEEIIACGAILEYVQSTQRQTNLRLCLPKKYSAGNLVLIDSNTRKNLEICSSHSGPSLFKVMDHTKTNMGGRMLRQNLESPLICPEAITLRLTFVSFLIRARNLRNSVSALLALTPDIERCMSRILMNRGGPIDILNIGTSLKISLKLSEAILSSIGNDYTINNVMHYKQSLAGIRFALTKSKTHITSIVNEQKGHFAVIPSHLIIVTIQSNIESQIRNLPQSDLQISQLQGIILQIGPPCHLSELKRLYEMLGDHAELIDLLEKALNSEPVMNKKDGGYINPSFDPRLLELYHVSRHSSKILSELTERYKRSTGISSLKISSNNLIGYYIEVPSGEQLDASIFKFRQSLSNTDRYITEELLSLENKISSAKESALSLEIKIFEELCSKIAENYHEIMLTSEAIGKLDFFISLASLAEKRNYCMPTVDSSLNFIIKDGRHPVVESNRDFVPNDTNFSNKERICLLTGPNMSGKSTFLRQNCLIALMAQIGSFVPALRAHIGVVDKIFSRVGASDQIATGKSTFMVEMLETSAIVNQSTQRSIVILDEVGRGTSLYDGLAIAWAVLEYLHDHNRCRTVFATHYHELCQLEQRLDRLYCYFVKTHEWNGELVFMHKIEPGSSELSLGIYVAKLAGMPRQITNRAEQILTELRSKSNLSIEIDA